MINIRNFIFLGITFYAAHVIGADCPSTPTRQPVQSDCCPFAPLRKDTRLKRAARAYDELCKSANENEKEALKKAEQSEDSHQVTHDLKVEKAQERLERNNRLRQDRLRKAPIITAEEAREDEKRAAVFFTEKMALQRAKNNMQM